MSIENRGGYLLHSLIFRHSQAYSKFPMKITNSGVFAEIFISLKWVFSYLAARRGVSGDIGNCGVGINRQLCKLLILEIWELILEIWEFFSHMYSNMCRLVISVCVGLTFLEKLNQIIWPRLGQSITAMRDSL